MKKYVELKKFKTLPYLVFAPIVSLIAEIVLIFVILSVMKATAFTTQNMLGVKQVIIVGIIFFAIYGAVEMLIKRNKDVKWYIPVAGTMFIPLAVELVLFLIALTYWWSHRTLEHTEFFMYLAGTMFIYLFVATAFRLLFQLAVTFLANDTPQKREKKMKKSK